MSLPTKNHPLQLTRNLAGAKAAIGVADIGQSSRTKSSASDAASLAPEPVRHPLRLSRLPHAGQAQEEVRKIPVKLFWDLQRPRRPLGTTQLDRELRDCGTMSKTRYEKSNLAHVLGKRGAQEVDTCALHKTRRICDENAAGPA